MRRLLGTVLLSVVLASSAVAAAPLDAANAAPSVSNPHPCRWHDRALCGSVTVPLDRSGRVPGTLKIGYERFLHSDTSRPALEPIVAVEGGPGYATTASRSYYLGLFRPLMDRHDLLLVDQRGTGTSHPIDCEPLQHIHWPFTGWIAAVGTCGRQLGAASDLYSSRDAADDLADVLDALHIPAIDLYGDSYGTFFSQTFAVLHGDRLRTLVLDAAYPIEDADPWWRDLSRAAAGGYRLACARDAGCAALGGDPLKRLGALDRLVARHPITGMAPDADGTYARVTITPSVLISIYDAGGYVFDPYRELDAAARAALKPHPDFLPILRLAREEVDFTSGGGNPALYSQGMDYAVSCPDYPQLYDMHAPVAERPAQYATSIRALQRNDPHAFAPFTIDQWVTSGDEDYDSCLRWPVPAHPRPLLPPGHTYPHVPTLVMVGDLDSVTSAEGARQVASAFPNSTFVEVANMTHVTALNYPAGCTEGIVLRFVRTGGSAGNTSCASDYPEIHVVDVFAVHAAEVPGPAVWRAATIATDTIGDVIARWDNMFGSRGVGLRGGSFTTTGYARRNWTLHRVRWVDDAPVSGRASIDMLAGTAHANLTIGGVVPHGHLHLSWSTTQPDAQVLVTGMLGGRHVRLRLPAP
jgi:pimeloyl-ACP methyl ester carboxylesterase